LGRRLHLATDDKLVPIPIGRPADVLGVGAARSP